MSAVDVVLNSTYFIYNNETYVQKCGVAMGSPVSATIANLVMEDLEDEVLNLNNLNIDFYRRFVDDIIIACDPHSIDNIVTALSGYNNKIKFTIEKEQNNCLNFLDLNIYR